MKRNFRSIAKVAIITCNLSCASAYSGVSWSSNRSPNVGNTNNRALGEAIGTNNGMTEPLSNRLMNEGRIDMVAAMKDKRQTRKEQLSLLLKTTELRRINAIEAEVAKAGGEKASFFASSTLARSKASGYGEDIEAYESAIAEGNNAREALVTGNMGLVYFCVNEIIGTNSNNKGGVTPGGRKRKLNSLSREDLIQEGSIGLSRAVDRWDPKIGGTFSTYAVYWIRAAVLRCIAERDDIVRAPEHVTTAIRKMSKAMNNLGFVIDDEQIISMASMYSSTSSAWEDAKSARAIAEEAGLTDKQFLKAMEVQNRRMKGGYVAFETWMQNGKDIESDIVTSTTATSSGGAVSNAEDVEHLRETLSRFLRPKEMEALSWRYGLIDDSSIRLEEQGKASKKSGADYLRKAEEEIFGSSSMPNKEKKMVTKGKWGEAMSFDEIGNRMQVSAEYTRRLCHAAIKKLQQAADDGQLEAALLV